MRTLVVGASGELGGAVARRLSAAGHKLVLHFHQDRMGAENLADEVGADDLLRADVTSESDVVDMVSRAGKLGLSGLVYAAGINPTARAIADTTFDDWRRTMQVNLDGAFLCARASIPSLRESESGAIVLVSSIFGLSSPAQRGAYGSAKHGLNGLVQSIAREEAPKIRINAVCPGAMWTENVRRIFPKHAKSVGISLEDYVKERTSQIPYGRFLSLEECASVISFLLGPDATFITGESIRVTGGEK